MKLPRYWAKGKTATGLKVQNPATGEVLENFSCWGWSDISMEEAEARGRKRAEEVAELIRSGARKDHYLYGDRAMREEILDEWKRADATVYAAVTLNVYGCQVLNTASIMFVDVDLPAVSSWDLFKHRLEKLFGNQGPSPGEKRETEAIAKVEGMVRADRRCGIRAYRTHSGLRYLLTHAHADPAAESTLRAMEALGADPLYVRLCKVQECFRARLNPKPWRCGIRSLCVAYPWADNRAEKKVRDWIDAYSRKAKGYSTCSLIKHYGSTDMDEEIARVVKFHDEITRAQSGLSLA